SEAPLPGPERSNKRRLISLVALLVFVGFGIFFFGPRMPREMQVRFELPPTLRGDGVALAREDARSLSAKVFDGERQPVGAVEISLQGLAGPRTGVFVMNLRPGFYAFQVEVKGGDRRGSRARRRREHG
ncbi:MAG TPA: hypothetical protein PK095_23550, partial [Myxococcota bacterium]|nr:hypothetical protein [Myxococcota bacterium]